MDLTYSNQEMYNYGNDQYDSGPTIYQEHKKIMRYQG